MSSNGANLYSVGFGTKPENIEIPVVTTRDPTASDYKYPIGKRWVNTIDKASFTLCSVTTKGTASTATWEANTPGSAVVASLTGDTGGAIDPTAGTIVIAGGNSISTAGTSGPGTITFNLDTAVVGITSITAKASTDLSIISASAQDVIVKMGDASGAQKVSFEDSTATEVASINSDGNVTAVEVTSDTLLGSAVSATVALYSSLTTGTITFGGTAQTGDFNIGVSSGTIAVNVGSGSGATALTAGSTSGASATTIQAGTGGITLSPAAAGGTTISAGNLALTAGGISFSQAGNGLTFKTGSNPVVGTTSAMTTGSVTVANTRAASGMVVLAYPATLGTVSAPQAYYIDNIVPGTSFDIVSADATDTSTWNYLIFFSA